MTAGELQAFVDALPIAAMIMSDRRILACNGHLADLAAVPLEELVAAEDPIHRFVAPEDQPVVLGRIAARARGELVPAELDYVGVGGNGERIPSRAHLAPFPSAGEHAVLVVITHEGLRARSASLIRGFVDVAVAAQRETTQAEWLRELGIDELVFRPSCASSALVASGSSRLAPEIPSSRRSSSAGRIGFPTRRSRCRAAPPKEC